MSDTISASRIGLSIGLAYTLPVMLWLVGQSLLNRTGQPGLAIPLQGMVSALLLLQAITLAVCLPWLMRYRTLRARNYGVAMVLFVPGPLYALAWLTGAAHAIVLWLVILSLVVFALLLHMLFTVCIRVTAQGQQRSLALLTLQLVLVGMCWNYHDIWQRSLGL